MATAKKTANDSAKPRAKAPRNQPRPGYVMVEFKPEERADLEAIRDRLAVERGERVTLAGTIRYLIRRAAR